MNIKKSIAALAVAGAMVAGVVGVSTPAMAAEVPGTIVITPTAGNVNTDTVFLDSIKVTTGATAPYNLAVGTFVYQGGVEKGNVSNLGQPSMPSTSGANSINGVAPIGGYAVNMDRFINPTNLYVSNKLLSGLNSPLASGPFELRYYWFDSATNPVRGETSPYVSLDMTFDATTGAWSVYTPPVAAIVTTTSLTAGVTANAGEVSLTATVKDGANTATAAAGDIVFKEGSTTVATVPVANGVAPALLTGVANGAHTYTAEFVPSDAVYAASVSGAATANVGGIVDTVEISVAIPTGVGELTLTGVSGPINMGTATLAGGTLNASGTVNAVVTDTRQLDYAGWNLTGVVDDFKDGTKVLDGKYLGWTPAKSGDATNSVAGAVVTPAASTGNGLKTSSVLVSGAPFAGGTVTNASGALLLKAPANTPAGAYKATLTLTLI